jgi:hypothetical protein
MDILLRWCFMQIYNIKSESGTLYVRALRCFVEYLVIYRLASFKIEFFSKSYNSYWIAPYYSLLSATTWKKSVKI